LCWRLSCFRSKASSLSSLMGVRMVFAWC
jgi:hypothetical protein